MAKKRKGSLKWLSPDHKAAAKAGVSYERYMERKNQAAAFKKEARALSFTVRAKKMQPETAKKILEDLRKKQNTKPKRIPKPPFKPMISVSLE